MARVLSAALDYTVRVSALMTQYGSERKRTRPPRDYLGDLVRTAGRTCSTPNAVAASSIRKNKRPFHPSLAVVRRQTILVGYSSKSATQK